MKKILSSKKIIRFQDCDPFQHLNNSKYIDYMINAREDQLRTYYDLDIYQMVKKEGVGWFVLDNKIAYLHPAKLMEEVSIETQLISKTNKSLTVEKRMFSAANRRLKAFMWTTYVQVDMRTQKSKVFSEKWDAFFRSAIQEVETQDFDERRKVLSIR